MTNHRKHLPLYLAFFLALITCCRVIQIQHGWITIDSILYFEMAKHIAVGDFTAAHAVEGYTWGFYPALIALMHVISGLTLQASANVLIVIFFMLLTWGLVRTASIAGGNHLVQFYAVLLLLGSGYIIGDILPMASRDLGYWALMIHAVNQLILFYQQGHWKHALLWQVLALLAMLFRIEGAVQILILPLAGFFVTAHYSLTRWRKIVAPYSLLITASLLIPFALLFTHIGFEDLGRVKEVITGFDDIQNNITQNLAHRVDIMRSHVIGETFKEFAWLTFLLAYFLIATLKCLSVAGWAPTLLVLAEKDSIQRSVQPIAYKVLLFWMFVSWFIGCLIAFKVNLLSARYVALFGFALIILASFVLHRLLHNPKAVISKVKRMLLAMVLLIVFVGFVGNIKPKSDSFYYEIEAVNYVKAKLLNGQQALYTSSKQRFYAAVPFDGRDDHDWEYLSKRLDDGSIDQFAYVMIEFDNSTESRSRREYLIKELNRFQLEKIFYGYKNKKQILVFKKMN